MPAYLENRVAVEALREKGFLTPNDRVRRGELADDLTARLKEHHVVTSIDADHFRQAARTLDELTVDTFGVLDSDLRYIVAQLTAPSYKGPVQERLNDGLVLCSHPVPRLVGNGDGQPIERTFPARFVSSSVEVLRNFFLNPKLAQVESMATNLRATIDLAVQRVPELKPHADALARELTGRYTAVLTAPRD